MREQQIEDAGVNRSLIPNQSIPPHLPRNGEGAFLKVEPIKALPQPQPSESPDSNFSAEPRSNLNSGILMDIGIAHRSREDLHRAEKSLTLQIKARCRGLCAGDLVETGKLFKRAEKGDSLEDARFIPFFEARDILEKQRKECEKEIIKLVRKLPIWENWAKDIRGIGELSLGQIIGETGDISNYATVSKLWKRMGVAVLDGGRQRNISGNPEKNIEHGYSGKRRSILFIVGDNLIRAKNVEYRVIYDHHKTRWEEMYPDGSEKENNGKMYKMTKGWRNNHAKRVMSKQFLKDLWRVWNQLLDETQLSFKPQPVT